MMRCLCCAAVAPFDWREAVLHVIISIILSFLFIFWGAWITRRLGQYYKASLHSVWHARYRDRQVMIGHVPAQLYVVLVLHSCPGINRALESDKHMPCSVQSLRMLA